MYVFICVFICVFKSSLQLKANIKYIVVFFFFIFDNLFLVSSGDDTGKGAGRGGAFTRSRQRISYLCWRCSRYSRRALSEHFHNMTKYFRHLPVERAVDDPRPFNHT